MLIPLVMGVLHTVAMMMRRCAMSATLCSRSGAMRAKFSLAKSHDGKMCTTYAAYSEQMNWLC